MSQLEDEIRDGLRAGAGQLREVRPLRLPPAPADQERRRARRAPWAGWQRSWQAPVAAAAVIVLVAAALVTAKVLRSEDTAPSAPGPVAASTALSAGTPAAGSTADATPRYYLRTGWVSKPGSRGGWAIIAGDVRTGKTLGTYPLTAGNSISATAAGAADDRTFVVSAGVPQSARTPVFGPARWYLVRLYPGTAQPLRVASLPVQATSDSSTATDVVSTALSPDGTELAVVFNTGKAVGLSVYSVATGRLQHSWSAAMSGVPYVSTPVADPSWVGDRTVGFAYVQAPHVRQEVRTLDIGSAGTDLLADSHVAWSQHVQPPAAGASAKNSPQTCDTPRLTGDGQVVVCATSSYSAKDKRLSAVWLAYPLATPGRPRVIGSVKQPQDVSKFNGPNRVDWTNSSGTEVIGAWNPAVVTYPKGNEETSVTNDQAFIGHGTVRSFPWISGPLAW